MFIVYDYNFELCLQLLVYIGQDGGGGGGGGGTGSRTSNYGQMSMVF